MDYIAQVSTVREVVRAWSVIHVQVWTGGLESSLGVFSLYRVMVFQGQLTVLWLSSVRRGSALMLFSSFRR